MKKIMLIALASLVFSSCYTTLLYEPEKSGDSLVMGCLEFEAANVPAKYGISMSGTHHSGVKLEILETSTGKEFNVVSGVDGFFYFVGKPDEEYQIKKILFKKKNGKSWFMYSSTLHGLSIKPQAGVVHNLGTIHWFIDASNEGNDIKQIRDDFDKIQEILNEKYFESGWNQFVIEETIL
ncbi:MAG: hypothetical protein MI717_06925 [Spirochaetales bacterium]|nr:hypothetical protein [Spirochaetales bacterium]